MHSPPHLHLGVAAAGWLPTSVARLGQKTFLQGRAQAQLGRRDPAAQIGHSETLDRWIAGGARVVQSGHESGGQGRAAQTGDETAGPDHGAKTGLVSGGSGRVAWSEETGAAREAERERMTGERGGMRGDTGRVAVRGGGNHLQ